MQNGIKRPKQKRPKKNTEKKARKKKMPNDSLTERKNVENVNLYILKYLDVIDFIDMSIKKYVNKFILIILQTMKKSAVAVTIHVYY
jgi:hypothetical protein